MVFAVVNGFIVGGLACTCPVITCHDETFSQTKKTASLFVIIIKIGDISVAYRLP